MNSTLKRIAARLPFAWQQQLKRHYFARQLRQGRFVTDEQEFGLLDSMVRPGDWVLDVGANIGHYTSRLSQLVGPGGRVVAFEPVPATFELLASNVSRLACANVTLLNVAASDTTRSVGMSMPAFHSGLANFYMARIGSGFGDLNVMAITVDGLGLPQRVTLVKIDAEGHELSVLQGMRSLLERDRPALIVEDNSPELEPFLVDMGYSVRRLPGSSNAIYVRHP